MFHRRGIFAGLLLICVLHSGAWAKDEHVETTYVNVQGPDEIIEGKPQVIIEEKPEIKEEVSYLPDDGGLGGGVGGRIGSGVDGRIGGGVGPATGNTRVSVGGGIRLKAKHLHKHTDWISEYAWSAIKRKQRKVEDEHLFKKQVKLEAKMASAVLRREPVERPVGFNGGARIIAQWGRQSFGIKKAVAVAVDLDCGGRVCRSDEKCVTRRSQVEIDEINKRILKHKQDYKTEIAIEIKKHNAALMSRILKDDSGEKFEHACEGGAVTVSCPTEYVIHVLRGFYGRTSDAYCNHGTPKTYQCSSPRATGIFASQCNGKQSCRVNSNNGQFGDPCVGTYKYATVAFKCRLSASIRKRYDSERVQLNQVFQQKVKGFHDANVRKLTFLRNLRAKAMHGNQQCVDNKAEAKGPRLPMRGIKCGRRRCKISQSCITIRRSAKTVSNIEAAIKKHEKSYRTKHADLTKQREAALKSKLRLYLSEKFNHACEHAKMTVTCPPNYVIQVLRGFYGRRTDAYCNHGKPKTYRCSSDRANPLIASLCNGKNSCSVKSTSNVFGDPCPGTYKYAAINYRCMLPVSARNRHASFKRGLVRRFRRLFEELRRWYRRRLRILQRRLVKASHGTHRCLSKRGMGDLDDRRRRRNRRRRGPKCGQKRCGRRQECVRKVSRRRLALITLKMNAVHDQFEKTISIATHQQSAAIDSKTVPIYLAERDNSACEGGSVTISCPVNYAIQVLRGFYGRVSNAICPAGPRKTLTCSSAEADSKVMSRCNDKPACTVESKNEVFGDPCVGTYKYLTVNYRCRLTIPAEKQFEAERARLTLAFNSRLGGLRNSYQLTMASLKKKWREVGRGKTRCVRRRPRIGFECGGKRCKSSEKCILKTSNKKIRQLQDSITALTSRFNQKIAVLSMEQLSVIRKDTLAIYLAEKFVHACEGASLLIDCPVNYVIQVLRGFYGRTSNTYCSHGPRKNYRCSSSIANSRVISACNNKRSCTVISSNSVFGDPCVGTYKYMTVNYKCRLSSTVEKQFQQRRKQVNLRYKVRESALRIVYNRRLASLLRKLSRAKRGGYRCVPDNRRRGGRGRRSRRRRSHRGGEDDTGSKK